MSEFTIEAATNDDLPACLALLTPVNHCDSVVLAARRGDGALAGAAAVLWQSWGKPPGFPSWLHVLPDCRRRGLGRALACALFEMTRGETPSLWSAQPLLEDSPASQFASSIGFVRAGKQFVFKADAEELLRRLEPMLMSLRARRRIPSSVRLAPLSFELIPSVARLLLSELATIPQDIGPRMTVSLGGDPASKPIDCHRSRVLLSDGRIAGALLSRRLPDGCSSSIICNVIAPEFRRGWANAVLLESVTRIGVLDGCRTIQFDCDDTNHNTLGLAARCSAQLMRVEALFRYAVTSC